MSTHLVDGLASSVTGPVVDAALARLKAGDLGHTHPTSAKPSLDWFHDLGQCSEAVSQRDKAFTQLCDWHPVYEDRSRERAQCSPTLAALRVMLAAGRSLEEIAFYTGKTVRAVGFLCRANDLHLPTSRPLRQFRHPRYLQPETKRQMIDLWALDDTRVPIDQLALFVGRTRRQTLDTMRRLGFRYGRGGIARNAFRTELADLTTRSRATGLEVVSPYAERLPEGFPGAETDRWPAEYTEKEPPPYGADNGDPAGFQPVRPFNGDDDGNFRPADVASASLVEPTLRPAAAPEAATGEAPAVIATAAALEALAPALPEVPATPVSPSPGLPLSETIRLIRPRSNPRQLAASKIRPILDLIADAIDLDSFRSSKRGSESLKELLLDGLRLALRHDYKRTSTYLEPPEPRTQKGWSEEERAEILIRAIGRQHREGIAHRFGASVNVVNKMMTEIGIDRKSWPGFMTRRNLEKRRCESFIFNLNSFRESPFWQKYHIRWCPYAGYFWAREIGDPTRYSPRKVALSLCEMRF